jgi:CSLREA domain-containing protein
MAGGPGARRRRIVSCCLATLSATLAGGLLSGVAQATTFTVNTTADSSDTGGCTTSPTCSLRDAVAAADAANGNTVMVPAGHYELNTTAPILGELRISVNTTIIGAGAASTIVDATTKSRVFDITNSGATVRIEGLTVTGGAVPPASGPMPSNTVDGGGIFDSGFLDLEGVAVVNNTATFGGGGVSTPGVPLLESGSGTPRSAVLMNLSTVANNSVKGGAGNGQGGGMTVFGNLTMTNSTIAANSVSDSGLNEGGGLVAADGIASLTNDTITRNTVQQAGLPPGMTSPGDLGGGLSGDHLSPSGPFSSSLHARNTIIAGNLVDGSAADCSQALVNTTITAHNLSSDSTCGFTDAGSKQNTDPKVGSLQNNGGQADTAALTPGSPAIDAGDNTNCPAQDERGVVRPQGAGCDIGAVEFAPPGATTGAFGPPSPTGAIVTGEASNPDVVPGTAFFQYGTTSGYGLSTPPQPVAAQVDPLVLAALSGLYPGTVYHYRLVVQNPDATTYGTDAHFQTSTVPPGSAVQPGSGSGPGTPGPSCLDIRRFRFHLHGLPGERVVRVLVYVDGRRILRRRGHRLKYLTVTQRPIGNFTIRIVAITNLGSRIVSTRLYRGCAKLPPRTVVHRHHP